MQHSGYDRLVGTNIAGLMLDSSPTGGSLITGLSISESLYDGVRVVGSSSTALSFTDLTCFNNSRHGFYFSATPTPVSIMAGSFSLNGDQGLYFDFSANVTVSNVVVSGNGRVTSTANGVFLRGNYNSALFSNVTFSGNSARGLYWTGYNSNTRTTIDNCTFELNGNRATTSSGGLYIDGSGYRQQMRVSNCVFDNNNNHPLYFYGGNNGSYQGVSAIRNAKVLLRSDAIARLLHRLLSVMNSSTPFFATTCVRKVHVPPLGSTLMLAPVHRHLSSRATRSSTTPPIALYS
jgi:hypothetical protein